MRQNRYLVAALAVLPLLVVPFTACSEDPPASDPGGTSSSGTSGDASSGGSSGASSTSASSSGASSSGASSSGASSSGASSGTTTSSGSTGSSSSGGFDGGLTGETSVPPWGTTPSAVLSGCDPGTAPPADTSTGYLMITTNQLARMKADQAANKQNFKDLKANADKYLTNLDQNNAGPENQALMYLLTKDVKYATSAYSWAKAYMAAPLTFDSYLEFGTLMRGVALVLNWAHDGLTGAQQTELANYLHASTDELWFHNTGSKWGISDTDFTFAGNNYRMAFIEGTTYAGYALKSAGDARGDAWIALAIDKIDRAKGVMEYIDTKQKGGDWLEGTNYGERSKQRLYRAMATIASMGAKNYFTSHPFFANSIQYAVYQTQPGNKVMYPGGDLARSAGNETNPFSREYVQLATYWLCDSPARRLGQWYLTKIMPTYLDGSHSFNQPSLDYMEMMYPIDVAALDPATLPMSYKAEGTNWINARSSWAADATSLSISGSPTVEQSHQAFDVGSFVLYKKDWLMVDPETYGGTGLWAPEQHQGLNVPGRSLRFDTELQSPGLKHFADKTNAVYAQVDASNIYRKRNGDVTQILLNEHTRELVYIRPDTLFVFDRVDAKPGATGYSLTFHFPSSPTKNGNLFSATKGGGGITLAQLLGGAATTKQDTDFGSSAYRLEEAASGAISRYLNVIQVGSGAAPAITPTLVGAAGGMQGAVSGNTVVMFSDLAKGVPAALPVTYTVPGTAALTHVFVNMTGTFNVTAVKNATDTQVTVSAGAQVAADADGFAVATTP